MKKEKCMFISGLILCFCSVILYSCRQEGVKEETVVIDPQKGGTLSLNEVTVIIPAGSISGQARLKIEECSTSNCPFSEDAFGAYRIEFKEDVEILNSIKLIINIDPSQFGEGEVPQVMYYDEELEKWVPEPNQIYDRGRGELTVYTQHLSVWAWFKWFIEWIQGVFQNPPQNFIPFDSTKEKSVYIAPNLWQNNLSDVLSYLTSHAFNTVYLNIGGFKKSAYGNSIILETASAQQIIDTCNEFIRNNITPQLWLNLSDSTTDRERNVKDVLENCDGSLSCLQGVIAEALSPLLQAVGNAGLKSKVVFHLNFEEGKTAQDAMVATVNYLKAQGYRVSVSILPFWKDVLKSLGNAESFALQLYNSGCKSEKYNDCLTQYARYVKSFIEKVGKYVSMSKLVLILPYYTSSTYHDSNIENITNAVDILMKEFGNLNVYKGAGIYAFSKIRDGYIAYTDGTNDYPLTYNEFDTLMKAFNNLYKASNNICHLKWSLNNVKNWRIEIGDVNGDGKKEIVALDITNSMLRVISSSGIELWNVYFPSAQFTWGDGILLADVVGTSTPEILVGYRDSSNNIKVDVYSGNGTFLKTLNRGPSGYDSSCLPVLVKGDNVFLMCDAGYSCSPRGISVLSYSTGNIVWEYLVGPSGGWGRVSIGDIEGDGVLDISLPSGTPHNGCSANNTNDFQLYSIVIKEDGTARFYTTLASLQRVSHVDGNYSQALVDTDGDGILEIIGFEGHDAIYYQGVNKIFEISSDGTHIVRMWQGPMNGNLWSFDIEDLNGDGRKEIIASTSHNSCGGDVSITENSESLYIISYDLSQTISTSPGVGRLLDVDDVDNDGEKEIIVVSTKSKELKILNSALVVEKSYSFPVLDCFSENRGRYFSIGDLDGNGRKEIVIAPGIENLDKLYVLEP